MKLLQMFRNLWIYRRLIGLTVLLGVVFFFVAANWSDVDVQFPLIGSMRSRVGVVMIASAALGAAATWLTMTFRHAIEEARRQRDEPAKESSDRSPANVAATDPEKRTEPAGPKSGGP